MSDEERTKQRNRERLEDEGMMHHMLFMAAAMAGGEKPAVAAKSADQAISEIKKRFL